MTGRLLLTMMLAAAPAIAGAADFTVTSAAGQPVSASALLAGDRRVLVYVAPGPDPAARLVEALRTWSREDPRWRHSVVVVVVAPLDQARRWLRERWGEGELPQWAADADAQGWRALGFDGTLGVAGVEKGVVDWKLDGVIADPSVLEPPIRAWTGIGAP